MSNAKVDLLLSELEELAGRLNVRLRYEVTKARGGMCQKDGQYMFIVDKKAAKEYRLQMLARALKTFDLSEHYISPKLREYLDEEV